MTISFQLNNELKAVDVPAETPLLWVLREELGYTGTKFGCGMGLCGACTVHLNGVAVRSCQIPVAAAMSQNVTTIEGLSVDGSHPLQMAWKEFNVPQCGYCQPGQLMSAAYLLAANKQPSDQEIDQGMSGNICRCGTYPRIKKAIRRAIEMSAESKETLND